MLAGWHPGALKHDVRTLHRNRVLVVDAHAPAVVIRLAQDQICAVLARYLRGDARVLDRGDPRLGGSGWIRPRSDARVANRDREWIERATIGKLRIADRIDRLLFGQLD